MCVESGVGWSFFSRHRNASLPVQRTPIPSYWVVFPLPPRRPLPNEMLSREFFIAIAYFGPGNPIERDWEPGHKRGVEVELQSPGARRDG